MKLRFLVICIFVERHSSEARVGPKDQDISSSVVDDLLDSFGMSSPLRMRRDLDPMWYLIREGKPIGYVRVFDDERWACNWFYSLRDKTTAWAHWHNGHPAIWTKEKNYKAADQFPASIVMCSIRAFTAHSAAERGWERWSTGRLTAIRIYLSRDGMVWPPQERSPQRRVEQDHDSQQGRARLDREPNWIPPAAFPPSTARQPPPPQLQTTKTFAAAPNRWQVKRGETGIDGPRPRDELCRAYEFSGLPPPDTTAMVCIECIIESDGLRSTPDGSTGLSLNRHVRFYLRPFRLPQEAEFVLRVTTKDQSEGGNFDVLGSPIDSETAMFARFGGRNDTATLLRALMAGKDLMFEVLQGNDSLVKLPLQNDGEFKRLWDESADRFAEIETAYEIVRSRDSQASRPETLNVADEVRKNPKAYAVWMIEQEPGEYGVLLVKLDKEGGMEDAWQLGQPFPNRTAQSSYALQVARDFGIKLMDVVKN